MYDQEKIEKKRIVSLNHVDWIFQDKCSDQENEKNRSTIFLRVQQRQQKF